MTIVRAALSVGLVATAALAACSSASKVTAGATSSGSGATGAGGSTAGTGGHAGGAAGHAGKGGANGKGGESGKGGAGAAGAGGGPFMTAAHAALPQVVTFGGPVLSAPKVQPIAYASDPGLTDVNAFLQELTTSTYWSETTKEYGVGPLTVLPTITIATAAPAMIEDATLQANLATYTQGASPAWGAADASTIYLFLLPQGTIVNSNGLGCQSFDGYHFEAPVGALTLAYAVSCSCPGFDGPGITLTQERTINISHELVEAATDPFPNSNAAWAQEDNPDVAWSVITGGEVADMCEFNDDSFFIPPGSKYMIQRSWSNAAAKKSVNPCVPPTNTGPFFDVAPVYTDMVTVGGGGPPILVPGVKLAVGQSTTIDLHLYSDAPTKGPWTVRAYDANQAVNGGSQNLKLSLTPSSGQNGDTLKLAITLEAVDAQYGGTAFLLDAVLGAPGDADFQSNIVVGWVAPN